MGARPRAIQIDPVANKVYWIEYGRRRIMRANLDGSGAVSLGDLGGLLDSPLGIALDLSAGKMYIANYGDNNIIRANLDGTNPEDLGDLGGNLDLSLIHISEPTRPY